MKKCLLISLYTFLFGFSLLLSQSMNSRDLVVPLWVEVTKSPNPTIKLKWERSGYVQNYVIYKRLLENPTFGAAIANLDSMATEWTDVNVKLNEVYEYQVLGFGRKYVKENDTLFAYRVFAATGYTLAGIEAIPKWLRGTALLLVDETMINDLTAELSTLQTDLEAEGYNVVIKSAPRAEKFDPKKVVQTKLIILDAIKQNPDISNILLIGRIPVPYSGDFNPDAHPDHRGAWPADVYYATDTTLWKDITVNNSVANRQENKNIPGDGKFDLTTLPAFSTVPIAVGRIDMYGMKLFYDTTKAKPEVELIKKYLKRNHEYRTGQIPFERKALVDDNFSAQSYPEGFAASGWRAFLNFYPSTDVKTEDFITTLSNKTYQWSYGCGGGSYTSAGGIGTSADFASKGMNGIFTFLFGSYFGDWDIDNNFLRAPLAAKPGALTIGWSGRPHWFIHHMNLGEPIGTSLLATQNNNNLYLPNIYFTPQFPDGVLYTTGTRQVHIALLGDPTLRMITKIVPQPKNLQVVELPNGYLKLNWEKPEGLPNAKYIIYRNTEKNPRLVLVTPSPISASEFEDMFLFDGKIYYQVLAVDLDSSRSGTFYVASRPATNYIKTVGISQIESKNINVYPNPATEYLTINFSSDDIVKSVTVIDIFGNKIKSFNFDNLSTGNINIKWDLLDWNNDRIDNGVYFVEVTTTKRRFIEKVIVNR